MIFNEFNHTYFNEQGDQYTSGTAFIKMFCKPFERDKIAAKYAKKHKKKVQDVLDEWSKAGDDAIKKGTFYHKMKEDELLEKENVLIEDHPHIIFRPIWNEGIKTHKSQKLEEGIYPELIVWSDKYKIAGQADYVEITKSGRINITDYKTSKEIKKQGFEKWDGSRDTMTFPLHNLDDCNFNHYALQINLYAFLIKQHNRDLKIGKLTIEHVIGILDDGKFKLEATDYYKVPNLQTEIKTVLEYYKENGNKIIRYSK